MVGITIYRRNIYYLYSDLSGIQYEESISGTDSFLFYYIIFYFYLFLSFVYENIEIFN